MGRQVDTSYADNQRIARWNADIQSMAAERKGWESDLKKTLAEYELEKYRIHGRDWKEVAGMQYGPGGADDRRIAGENLRAGFAMPPPGTPADTAWDFQKKKRGIALPEMEATGNYMTNLYNMKNKGLLESVAQPPGPAAPPTGGTQTNTSLAASDVFAKGVSKFSPEAGGIMRQVEKFGAGLYDYDNPMNKMDAILASDDYERSQRLAAGQGSGADIATWGAEKILPLIFLKRGMGTAKAHVPGRNLPAVPNYGNMRPY
jgi:hypothetical protein